MGSKEDIAAKIEAETRQKMNEMNQLVAQHKKAVIEKLLSLVYDIDPQVHRNFRPAHSEETPFAFEARFFVKG
ncbi:hypothetical protein V5799_014664 [Amblyomma americanum]|uniref:V-type proton ATPase subunit G n=1 Tax=Amblyomma americanum TaxID=6943 RepID=A0AAQ4E2D1_AMBAM